MVGDKVAVDVTELVDEMRRRRHGARYPGTDDRTTLPGELLVPNYFERQRQQDHEPGCSSQPAIPLLARSA